MELSDLPRTQRELMTAVAESSARLAKVWSDALKKAGPPTLWDNYKGLAGWITPRLLLGAQDVSSALTSFQQVIDQAAKDLPELLKNGPEKEKVKRIKDRWMKSYEKLVRDAFGIPPKSETERFLEQWNSLLRPFSKGKSQQKAEAFQDLATPMAFMRWFLPGDKSPESNIFTQWWQTYVRTVGSMFRPDGKSFPRDFEDMVKRALDAQVALWNSVSDLSGQVMSAAGKGMDKLINNVLGAGLQKITPETYPRFHETWITSHEEALAGLFKTEAFGAIASDTARKALEAKRAMDTIMAESLSFWNVPSKKDLEALQNEIEILRGEVRRLGEQIDALKRTPEEQPEAGK